uniref:Uncharacterized protein n=1 Tax=Cyanistes caeruleus TaxID=156563 RepID=A0A8C0VXH3_CYACU
RGRGRGRGRGREQAVAELPSDHQQAPSAWRCKSQGAAAVLAGAWGCSGNKAQGNLFIFWYQQPALLQPDKKPGR